MKPSVPLRLAMVMLGIGGAMRLSAAKLSPEAAAKLSGALHQQLPKYDPRPPTPVVSGEAQEAADGTLILPTMQVRQQGFPPGSVRPSERERLTRAMKSHPGLKIGNLGQTANVAVLLEREETLAAHKAETSGIIDGATLDATTPDAKKIRTLLGAALQQSNRDWEYGRGGTPSLHTASPPPPTPDREKDRRRK